MVLLCSPLSLGGRPRGRFSWDSAFSVLMKDSGKTTVNCQVLSLLKKLRMHVQPTHLKSGGSKTLGLIRNCRNQESQGFGRMLHLCTGHPETWWGRLRSPMENIWEEYWLLDEELNSLSDWTSDRYSRSSWAIMDPSAKPPRSFSIPLKGSRPPVSLSSVSGETECISLICSCFRHFCVLCLTLACGKYLPGRIIIVLNSGKLSSKLSKIWHVSFSSDPGKLCRSAKA